MLHGIRSHGGWYGRSCAKLAEAGFEVYFIDRRGSGLNTAHRGDAPGFRRLIDDVAEFCRHLRESRSWLPIFVVGISWGGKLALGLAARRPGFARGLVLLCPGLAPKVSPTPGQRLWIALARALRPDKFFPIPLNDPELFTASPERRKFIDVDPHGLHEATARFLFASAAFDFYLKRNAKRIDIPVLTMLAGRDRVIDNAGTRKFLIGLASRDNRVIDYPNAEHTLEFEAEGHPFVGDMREWVEKRLS